MADGEMYTLITEHPHHLELRWAPRAGGVSLQVILPLGKSISPYGELRIKDLPPLPHCVLALDAVEVSMLLHELSIEPGETYYRAVGDDSATVHFATVRRPGNRRHIETARYTIITADCERVRVVAKAAEIDDAQDGSGGPRACPECGSAEHVLSLGPFGHHAESYRKYGCGSCDHQWQIELAPTTEARAD